MDRFTFHGNPESFPLSRDLAFCDIGFPLVDESKLPALPFVPLNANLLLIWQGCLDRLVWPATEISARESEELQDSLNARWDALLAEPSGPPYLRYYMHEFMEIAAPLAVLEWTVAKVLEQFGPTTVFFQPVEHSDLSGLSTRSQALTLAKSALLKEMLGSQSNLRILAPPARLDLGLEARSRIKAVNLDEILGAIARSLTRRRASFRAFREVAKAALGASKRNGVRPHRMLAVAQEDKIWGLLSRPRLWAQADLWSYSQLEDRFNFRREFSFDRTGPLEGSTPAAVLSEYIKGYASANTCAHDAVRAFVETTNFEDLVTDAHHHPLVRQLVSDWTESGKRAALIPEGAIYPDEQLWPRLRHNFIQVPKATRFVLSEEEQRLWVGRGENPAQLIVSGYVGNTRARSSTAGLIVRSMCRRATRPFDQLTIGNVLVTFDVLLDPGDLGVRWVGAPTAVATNSIYLELIQTLVKNDWFVFAKGRQWQVDAKLRQTFSNAPVLFVTRAPWQLIAESSDVVLTLTSSVGAEALDLGYRVVVLTPFEQPTVLERNLQPRNSDRLRTCKTIEEVHEALLSLMALRQTRSVTNTRSRSALVDAQLRTAEAWFSPASNTYR